MYDNFYLYALKVTAFLFVSHVDWTCGSVSSVYFLYWGGATNTLQRGLLPFTSHKSAFFRPAFFPLPDVVLHAGVALRPQPSQPGLAPTTFCVTRGLYIITTLLIFLEEE